MVKFPLQVPFRGDFWLGCSGRHCLRRRVELATRVTKGDTSGAFNAVAGGAPVKTWGAKAFSFKVLTPVAALGGSFNVAESAQSLMKIAWEPPSSGRHRRSVWRPVSTSPFSGGYLTLPPLDHSPEAAPQTPTDPLLQAPPKPTPRPALQETHAKGLKRATRSPVDRRCASLLAFPTGELRQGDQEGSVRFAARYHPAADLKILPLYLRRGSPPNSPDGPRTPRTARPGHPGVFPGSPLNVGMFRDSPVSSVELGPKFGTLRGSIQGSPGVVGGFSRGTWGSSLAILGSSGLIRGHPGGSVGVRYGRGSSGTLGLTRVGRVGRGSPGWPQGDQGSSGARRVYPLGSSGAVRGKSVVSGPVCG
ncbi:hypothetical protein GWK47_051659 [Chionoecetes opilio]|uniref:Uncharacterized protein n=1 Tax=Chionoecetes opilio TaxID=41210 RepID=A0A8J4Y0L0_CHIOP|nr:hypothetical protein GWK47_051659 [Chionoecetes opilio]